MNRRSMVANGALRGISSFLAQPAARLDPTAFRLFESIEEDQIQHGVLRA